MSAVPSDGGKEGPFLSEIQTLRRRAREHIENGAITPGYHADPDVVIEHPGGKDITARRPMEISTK